MKKHNYISYFLILLGGGLAIYGQSGAEKNVLVLVLGIIVLMFGIFRISSHIPSKYEKELEREKTQENEEDEL
ncbi:hypothetical protein ACFSQP_10755 [Bizionia sediminis]|uniref:DUF3098 domain-containing protein n=1 Tax=Bizionia sediminis TaxID=1737064 RepID=A0ABW5KXE9_9FLAO